MFSCFLVRQEGLYWFTYFLKFDEGRNYERFVAGEQLDDLTEHVPVNVRLSSRRGEYSCDLLPVPDGRYGAEDLFQSDSEHEAISVAQRARANGSVLHGCDDVDPCGPIFVEIDGVPLAVDRIGVESR